MRPLSVLHVSTYDNRGGSGKSAYKIHRGLRDLGVRSRMLVGFKTTTDPDVDVVSRRAWDVADKVVGKGLDALGLQYVAYPSSFNLLRHPWVREADVVQLYNTHFGYFSHSVLPFLARGRSLVWRLSDMWPMTGHCAYSGPCEGWRTGCAPCPDLGTYPALRWDSASLLWKWKRALYRRTPMHFVAPSRWIQSIVSESPLTRHYANSYIPNGLDTAVFRPLDRSACRRILGIDGDLPAVLFLSHSLQDPKKGGPLFLEAMNALWDTGRRFRVMAVGEHAHAWEGRLKCPLWKRDYVGEDELLAMLYGAADLFVHCALRENFPNTTLEAMACGLPVAAFDSGGVRELVAHGENGSLVPSGDATALASAVGALLDSPEERARLSARAREAVETRFSLGAQASAFLKLYGSLRQAA